MLIDVIIKTGSELWCKMTFAAVAGIAFFIIIPKYIPSLTNKIRICFGVLFLIVAISIHPYMIYLGTWNVHSSLPLQLCSLSGLLSGIVLLFPSQIGYELIMYWGIPAAFHSLLTPEMTQGTGDYFLYDYYISHGGIILSALFLTYNLNMRLRRNSWLKIFLISQLFIPIVGVIDYFLNANYMYLREKPEVENPLIIGHWPWYIVGFELFLFIHFYIVYFIFYQLRKPNMKTSLS